MLVWIVSLEWNQPPSEVTGETGIVGVFDTEAAARAAQRAEQVHCDRLDGDGLGVNVYEFSMRPGRYCGHCGELAAQEDGTPHVCTCTLATKYDDPKFCDCCSAELKDTGSCDNDHDEWDIDVHCTEHEVKHGAL